MAWIESGEYDNHVYKGVECSFRYPVYIRPLYRLNKLIQGYLAKKGIPLHDYVFGECTPEFDCCDFKRKKYCEYLKGMNYGGLPKKRK